MTETEQLSEYKCAKGIVKSWELQYVSEHDQKPDRKALSEAPANVRKAYSTVYKLKKILTSSQDTIRIGCNSNSSILENRNLSEKSHLESSIGKNSDREDYPNCINSVKENVWNKSLDVAIDKEVVVDKIPSDLYSKLANNMRTSFLASLESKTSHTRLSLNKSSKKKQEIESLSNEGKSISASGDLVSNNHDVSDGMKNGSHIQNDFNLNNEKCSDSEEPILFPKISVLNKNSEAIKTIKTSCSNFRSSMSSNLKNKYNSKWVERCLDSVSIPDSHPPTKSVIEETNLSEIEPSEKLESTTKDGANQIAYTVDYLDPDIHCQSESIEKIVNNSSNITDDGESTNQIHKISVEDFSNTDQSLENELNDKTFFEETSKRKRIESLEELVDNDKVTPLWPPPKKKRLSRITRNSVEEIERHKLNMKAKEMKKELVETDFKVNIKQRRGVRNKTANSKKGFESSTLVTNCEIDSKLDESIPEYNEQLEIENDQSLFKSFKKRKRIAKEDWMSKKLERGTLNDNFVKIDIKKKKFVKGGRGMTAWKHRRLEWKRKENLKSGKFNRNESEPNVSSKKNNQGKSLSCFKCGDFGHWASKCPGKRTEVVTFDEGHSDPIQFLTLEEATDMARGIKSSQNQNTTNVYPSQRAAEITDRKDDENSQYDFSDWEEDDILESIPESGEAEVSDHESYGTETSTSVAQNENNSNDCVSTDDYPRKNDSISDENLSSISDNLTVKPLLNHDVESCPSEVYNVLRMFGHSEFRPGQEKAILRILQGKNTLLVLSTGSGKSLCYQLPAYMYGQKYKTLTICVSPLVSLMEDQVTGLPPFLNAVCLHNNLTQQQKDKTLCAIKEGKVHILLVSPEAIVASRAGGLLGTLIKDIPNIGFACVDEAHCVSQWSHNFRPSYLRVCDVLRKKLGVKTILGLTATARYDTTLNIAEHLGIKDLEEGVITEATVPPNLLLSVSRDVDRENSLIILLEGERFGNCDSIIIYCTRRDVCERIATLLRTQMISSSKIDVKANLKRRRALSTDAEAYHAGLSSFKRKQIQEKFMSGKLRIVVATVAFGMGIDKSDVRAIIHFNMPRNLESYVQEIGRAGRDGLESHCHLFLDNNDGRDLQELKRFTYVNSVDRVTVKKLLDKLFVPCICNEAKIMTAEGKKGCGNGGNECPKHEIAIPVNKMIEVLDIPEENISTLLCYIEFLNKEMLQILSYVYSTCTVRCYGGASQLCSASKTCPPLAVAIAQDNKRGVHHQNNNEISFPVIQLASEMGWDSGIVKRELKSLEWITTGGRARPSGVKVEFSDLAMHFNVKGDFTDEERDDILEALYDRALQQETDELKQLQYVYQTLRAASHSTILFCTDHLDEKRCGNLKASINRYFAPCSNELGNVVLEDEKPLTPQEEQRLQQDIRSLLGTYTDQVWTARAVARVFHGIQSPNYPASTWGRVRKIWRCHLNIPFKHILTVAQQEIIRHRRL